MRIGETELSRMPPHLQQLFVRLPNPGREEVLAGFPETAPSNIGKPRGAASGDGWGMTLTGAEYSDSGSAARFFSQFPLTEQDRFFYCSKANAKDRAGSKHPTVKPIKLMRWLVRLITPPGGTVLDPFAGSGTTGVAAYEEGFRAILVEREAEYQADIARRFEGEVAPAAQGTSVSEASLSSHEKIYTGGIFG